VSQRLGHANVAFTLSQYAHVLPEHDAQSADRVATAMLGNDPQNEGTRRPGDRFGTGEVKPIGDTTGDTGQ
jgi:hypothetical protein